MTEPHVHRPVGDAAAALLRSVASRTAAALGHDVLGDSVERDLAASCPAYAIVAMADGEAVLGAMHLGAPRDGIVPGTLVVAPDARDRGVEAALEDVALEDLRTRGLARLEYWVFGDAARPSGTATRRLHQMRVELPLEGSARPRWPDGVRLRPFVPGVDDDAWLRVNNRAFAHDPDQGGWNAATLHGRTAEPWFDPAGLLLAEDDAGLAGFCWTRVHPAAPPAEPERVGEIYVIGVDPDRQGTGLGRALVVAGLASLAERGVEHGMLFVDTENAPALALYEALGFTTTRTDRMHVCPTDGADA